MCALREGTADWVEPLVWYFFNDVYPPLHDGHRPFDPPSWWIRLWEGRRREGEDEEQEEQETDVALIDHDIAAAAAPDVR